jgi:hypothetical protein
MRLKAYAQGSIMKQWEVVFDEEFDLEFEAFPMAVQNELYAQAKWIEHFLGRRHDGLVSIR